MQRILAPTLGPVSEVMDEQCASCEATFPEKIREILDELVDAKRREVQRKQRHEIRAHNVSNPLYKKLIGDIKRRARDAPESEGWADVCKTN